MSAAPVSAPASTTTQYWGVARSALDKWWEDRVPRLGAALAFYSILSLAPLLIIVIGVAGLVFGEEAARGGIQGQIRQLVGSQGAEAIEAMLAHASRPQENILATVIGVISLLVGAAGVFGQLQDALNTIWEVQPKPGRGVVGFLVDRFWSFSMVLGTGFLLLVSLVISALLTALGQWIARYLPESWGLLHLANTLVSLIVVTLLFAMIFKFLPDARIAWKDVWLGAIVTALLFTVGKAGIGLYLGSSGIGSAYGAAGSLVVLLVWIYYSAQIVFFGAELTYAYVKKFGPGVIPTSNAVKVTEDERTAQGMVSDERLEKAAARQRPPGYGPARPQRPAAALARPVGAPTWAGPGAAPSPGNGIQAARRPQSASERWAALAAMTLLGYVYLRQNSPHAPPVVGAAPTGPAAHRSWLSRAGVALLHQWVGPQTNPNAKPPTPGAA